MTVTEALQLARSQGVEVTLDGDDLVLKAEAAPPPRLLAILGRGKLDIVAALRLREAEERRRIVQWVNDHFASSPSGVCAHCRDGLRSEDPFVLLFVGNDRGEVHASCHPTWLAEREAEACRALGRPMTSIRKAESERGLSAVASLLELTEAGKENAMSMHYGLRKRITADELFDGRLEAFGVREEVRPEGTVDRYPSYMKVKEVRYLTDGRNSMKVIVYESGAPSVSVRNPWCALEGEIFYAIAKAFESDIVSDQQPEFWGFDTQEEWDAWQTRRAGEEEQSLTPRY